MSTESIGSVCDKEEVKGTEFSCACQSCEKEEE